MSSSPSLCMQTKFSAVLKTTQYPDPMVKHTYNLLRCCIVIEIIQSIIQPSSKKHGIEASTATSYKVAQGSQFGRIHPRYLVSCTIRPGLAERDFDFDAA